MPIASIAITGLRGFATRQQLELAQPNGELGSGLSIIVGPNNAGKSTIVEAFKAISTGGTPSFTEGRRNKRAGDRVSVVVAHSSDANLELRTVGAGGSETELIAAVNVDWRQRIFVLPSRRLFSPYFGRSYMDRLTYIRSSGVAPRGAQLDAFSARLFRMQQNGGQRAEFDRVFGRVVEPPPAWSIEMSDAGQYYVKLNANDTHHSSEGMGEGLVSLLFIVDALHDSEREDVIVIDEPELSLHPSLQRRLARLLSEYARDRQIVLSTHSPYFSDLRDVVRGAALSRVFVREGGSVIASLRRETVAALHGLLRNDRNPHILGLDAREVFFLDDHVLLVEGQDDVVLYERVAAQLGVSFSATFFGWGVGGADNMRAIAAVLRDLGFEKVGGLVDSNRAELLDGLRREFPSFAFEAISAEDVRTKPEVRPRPAVVGLLDEHGQIRQEFASATKEILERMARAVGRD